MAVSLEVKSGPFAGQKIPVRTGHSVLIGRAPDRAQFAIPHDNHMSGIHFAVECGPNGCRVIDKGSTNGTHLNGAKIQEAMLASGDEIKSGQTVFVVRIVPDDQLPAATSDPPAVAQPPAA
ncbi:MAG TPA: FHA domain-containing protein, partial [Candidatus Bathyarchaeia archaeon]|nr:FHA domain-containing protein [Candidatus Bathyarchaeia archaeon]